MQIKINGNLNLNGHIVTGNKSGSTTVAQGASANCSATGSATISGNDTAGVVTINTSTGTCTAGTLATVTFANGYGAAPVVVLTPAGANASTLQYYYNAAAGTFDIKTNNAPAVSTTYIYSYHVLK